MMPNGIGNIFLNTKMSGVLHVSDLFNPVLKPQHIDFNEKKDKDLINKEYPTEQFSYWNFVEFISDDMVLSSLFARLKDAGYIRSTDYEEFELTPLGREKAQS